MPARDDEDDGRQRHLAMLEDERLDVPGQMMDGDDRHAPGPRQRLRERDADEKRPDETGTLRHGNQIVRRHAGITDCPFHHAADVADMLARRQLRNDASPLAMNLHLRGDDARTHAPGPLHVAGLFDDRRRRFIA
jgi:hypothetical protein